MSDGSLKIRVNLDTKEYDAQIKELSSKLNDLQKQYNLFSKMKPYKGQEEDLRELEAQMEKVNNQIITLQSKNTEVVESGGKGWDTFRRKIQRFGLALFSIRGIYALVSRASSSYMEMDQELSDNLQSSWRALGSFLAPLLEYITNGLLKAVGYLNVFIKALTGIDFIARANAKALQKQANATKNLTKQMLGFDEANAFSSSSSSSSTDNGLINIPELDDSVVAKLEHLAEVLKDNWWWIKLVGEALLVAFGVATISKVLNGIGSLLGASGIGGLTGALKSIPTLIGISIIIANLSSLIQDVNNIKEEINSVVESTNNYRSSWLESETDINKMLLTQNTNMESVNDLLYRAGQKINKISGLSENYLNAAKNITTESEKYLDNEMKIYDEQDLTLDQKKQLLKTLRSQYTYNEKIIDTLEEEGQDTSSLVAINEKYRSAISKVSSALNPASSAIEAMKNTSIQIADIMGTKWNYVLNDVNKKIDNLNNFKVSDKSFKINIDAIANTNAAATSLSNLLVATAKASELVSGIIKTKTNTSSVSSLISGQIKSIFNSKLAVGGIVNNPGKGVALGGAITGESGREGVVPLTDSYAMEELGATIGRYITINNVIDNYMDGRKINRVLAQSKSTSDFASNR